MDAPPPIAELTLSSKKPVEIIWDASMVWQMSAMIRFLSPWDYQTLDPVSEPKIGELRMALGILGSGLRFNIPGLFPRIMPAAHATCDDLLFTACVLGG